MRDVGRMEPFLEEMKTIWAEKFPDWRFGQLMYNFFSAYGDPFYLEEDEFMIAFRAYSERKDPKEALKAYREERRGTQDKDLDAFFDEKLLERVREMLRGNDES